MEERKLSLGPIDHRPQVVRVGQGHQAFRRAHIASHAHGACRDDSGKGCCDPGVGKLQLAPLQVQARLFHGGAPGVAAVFRALLGESSADQVALGLIPGEAQLAQFVLADQAGLFVALNLSFRLAVGQERTLNRFCAFADCQAQAGQGLGCFAQGDPRFFHRRACIPVVENHQGLPCVHAHALFRQDLSHQSAELGGHLHFEGRLDGVGGDQDLTHFALLHGFRAHPGQFPFSLGRGIFATRMVQAFSATARSQKAGQEEAALDEDRQG